ncbi:hypothetical protein QS468_39775 [Bacillus subtilis]|nr:hypothetical protein [Pseudomonas sp. A29(2023)]MDL5598903.1 hypothetical protein [Bacillus subtilis]
MSYDQNPSGSARRHLTAARELHAITDSGKQPGCNAVAGYLFGLAGELAVKAIMLDSGMRPSRTPGDAFFQHFPAIKAVLKDQIHGRRAGELRQIAEDNALFDTWHTNMRYSSTNNINPVKVIAWKSSAEQLIARMDSL